MIKKSYEEQQEDAMFRSILVPSIVNGQIRETTAINSAGKTGLKSHRLIVFVKDVGVSKGSEIELNLEQAKALRDFLNLAIPALESEK